MLPTKFQFIWSNGFRGEESKKSTNQKQASSVAAMFVNGSGRNKQSLWRTCHRWFLPSFSSFGWRVLEAYLSVIQFRDNCILNRYKMYLYLNLPFNSKTDFSDTMYQSIRNKNRLWRPCLFTDQDEISNLYRGPAIDASYHVSVHLAKRFQRRRFLKNRPIRNKKFLWRPCLLMDRDKMSNLYRGPSIGASYQVSVHIAEGVSEEKIKMWKVNGRQTTDDRQRTTDAKWWQKLTLPLARWAKNLNATGLETRKGDG
jgi:hypothetical protein